MRETWRPIAFGKVYEVSDYGRIRNIRTGKLLTGTVNEDGYCRVYLSDDGAHRSFYLHVLIAETFLGPCPPGQQVRHWDGNPLNNRVTNLLYGTPSENVLDTIRYGNHVQARKTHCDRDHEFTKENTYVNPKGARVCKTCRREAFRRFEGQYKRVRTSEGRIRIKLSPENLPD